MIIVIAIMAFIFFQSALPADLSSEESGRVVDLIVRLFQGVAPIDRETLVFIVRKGAHFTEYMILGGFLVPAVKEWMAVDTTPVPAGSGGEGVDGSRYNSCSCSEGKDYSVAGGNPVCDDRRDPSVFRARKEL